MTNLQLNAMFDVLVDQIEKNQKLAKAAKSNEIFLMHYIVNGVLLALSEALLAAVKASPPEEEERLYEGK